MPREIFVLIGGVSLFLIAFALIELVLEYLAIAKFVRGKRMVSHLIVIVICCIVGAVCGEVAWRLSEGRYAIAGDVPIQQNGEEKIATPPAKKSVREVPKIPSIQQHSEGPNSPNIVGDRNVVTINPDNPEYAKKLQEIADAIKAQGETISREKLLAKFPLGYVIFELDYKDEVFPYSSQVILDKYELDWSVVRFTKNTATRVRIRLPDFKRKGGGGAVENVYIEGPKQVGNIGGPVIGGLAMLGEILAVRDKGIVFLVGFVQLKIPDLQKP